MTEIDQRLERSGLGDGVWNFEACRRRLREASVVVYEAEGTYHQAIERAADAEAVYRSELAKAFGLYRSQSKPVEESMAYARRDVGKLSRERDYAAGLVKLRADQLEGARDARLTVWRLVEWAREADLIARKAA